MLSRTHDDAEKPCSATSPAFKAGPGLWNIGGGIRPDLASPDSSFDGIVTLQCLGADGRQIDELTVADVFGKNGWNPMNGQFEVPQGTTSARFHIQLNKTWGPALGR